MNVGERINELRKKSNLTQEKLAELLCVSPQAISKWERGVANPDLYLIPMIAEVFNVSSDFLLGMTVPDTESRLERLENQIREMAEAKCMGSVEVAPRSDKKVACFDFREMSDEQKKEWRAECAEIIDTHEGIVFKAKAVERTVQTIVDPQLMISNIEVDLKDVLHMVVRLRTVGNSRNHALQVFYVTKENPIWDELKSFKTNYPNGNMVDVVIPCVEMGKINIGKVNCGSFANIDRRNPLSVMMAISDTLFRGTLIGLRIDPMNQGEGYCEVENVMLVKSSGEVAFCFDFSKESDRESDKCKLYNAKRRDSDSSYAFDISPMGVKGAVYDPQLIRDGLSIDISRAKQVHVRVRGELANKHKRGWYNNNIFYNANLQVFFTTEASPSWSAQKCATSPYLVGEGWFDLYLDMSKNILWCGTLTGIRIDPEGEDGIFEVELVEIVEVSDKGGAQRSGAEVRELKERIDDLESRLEELHCSYEELFDQYEELESKIEELETELKKKE